MRKVAVVGAGITPSGGHFVPRMTNLPMAFADCAASGDKGISAHNVGGPTDVSAGTLPVGPGGPN